jgi:hypothetical protein
VLWITHVAFLILPHHQLQTRLKLVAGSAHASYGPHPTLRTWKCNLREGLWNNRQSASVYSEDAIGLGQGFVWCLFSRCARNHQTALLSHRNRHTQNKSSVTIWNACTCLRLALSPKILGFVSSHLHSHLRNPRCRSAAMPFQILMFKHCMRGGSWACMGRSRLRHRRWMRDLGLH